MCEKAEAGNSSRSSFSKSSHSFIGHSHDTSPFPADSLREHKKRHCSMHSAVLTLRQPQKVMVRLGSVKEENVAVASVSAKTVVFPSPGV